MLDSGKKRTVSEGKSMTIVGQGTTFTGDIKSKVLVRVEGVVHGRVHSDDTVVIQETGRVKAAEIVANQIVISGEVEGNVFAHERLEITAQGRLTGDITAPRVSIAEGVMFEGKCTMKQPGQAKPGGGPGQESPKPAPPRQEAKP
jgi:cytoskeletal protein CcmA (bactofilin family)